MSRLIREEDALKIIRNGWSNHCSCKNMCDEISCLPTAYNVEEVVKELESLPVKTASKWVESKEVPEYFYEVVTGEYINKKETIEIVKGGVK